MVRAVTGGVDDITVTGVAADPDLTDDEPPQVAVSVDGTTTTEYATGAVTGDGSVADYTFDLIVPAVSGVHRVEVSILSSGGNQPDQAGTWTVDVARPAARHDDRYLVIGAGSAGVILIALAAGGAFWWRRRLATSAG